MKRIYFFILSFLAFCTNVSAQLTTRVVRDSLFIPWELVYGPDDHVWFTQKNGYICKLEPVSGHIDTLYHETNVAIQSEGGMLGLALHPQFPATPEIFVAYDYMQSGNYTERVVKYTYSSSSNTLSNPQILLDNIDAASFHNGCRLITLGDKLFITTGDATNQSNPQNLNAVNGKILRLNLDGTVPADNPFPGNPVWSFGHRNPQGLVYVPSLGKLYSSEHGPNNDDELNVIDKGQNYGWPDVEGYCNTASEISFCASNSVREPLQAWTPTIAVCGIDYYDKPMFPVFQNSIIMVTLKDQQIYQLKLSQGGDSVINAIIINGGTYGRLRDICVGPDGNIFISTSNSNASGANQIDKIIEMYDPSFVSVKEINKSNDLTLYPNPAGDYTIIKLPASFQPASLEYQIMDETGKVVSRGYLKGNNTKLPMKGLSPGVYHVKLTTDEGKSYKGKILKQ